MTLFSYVTYWTACWILLTRFCLFPAACSRLFWVRILPVQMYPLTPWFNCPACVPVAPWLGSLSITASTEGLLVLLLKYLKRWAKIPKASVSDEKKGIKAKIDFPKQNEPFLYAWEILKILLKTWQDIDFYLLFVGCRNDESPQTMKQMDFWFINDNKKRKLPYHPCDETKFPLQRVSLEIVRFIFILTPRGLKIDISKVLFSYCM